MDLKDIGLEDVDFIYLASNTDHWLAHVDMVHLWILKKAMYF